MFRTVMNSKIHRARVTESNLDYIGSITIDQDILDEVGLVPNEKVQIVNNNNGARIETYVIPGERGQRDICLNGAAARCVQKGDIIIIISYAMIDSNELSEHAPMIAFMDEENRIIEVKRGEQSRTEYK
ncbi:aspartate 1-decarboxylase [Abyssicoccus albus]|mgnify:CR=1 FL=1|uniref:Aspartate 1-decarboxylase n=1 Tax=Abyssicoccus albus TaxID=1817405 RepID=A0A1Q1G1P1_9BACL|nr:aspartate 1-decarboxylase [Abyssicoccus albus]AQL56257.1 aspartate 1-decarboxylase [Abyssicoccus albus]RPF57918.1 L-aspartate 1-decarboxylase [Abyssicoccus albus]